MSGQTVEQSPTVTPTEWSARTWHIVGVAIVAVIVIAFMFAVGSYSSPN